MCWTIQGLPGRGLGLQRDGASHPVSVGEGVGHGFLPHCPPPCSYAPPLLGRLANPKGWDPRSLVSRSFLAELPPAAPTLTDKGGTWHLGWGTVGGRYGTAMVTPKGTSELSLEGPLGLGHGPRTTSHFQASFLPSKAMATTTIRTGSAMKSLMLAGWRGTLEADARAGQGGIAGIHHRPPPSSHHRNPSALKWGTLSHAPT